MLALAATVLAAAAPTPRGNNVLYMVFDDFRPDLPFYGQPFVHAPYLTAQASKSLVFDRVRRAVMLRGATAG